MGIDSLANSLDNIESQMYSAANSVNGEDTTAGKILTVANDMQSLTMQATMINKGFSNIEGVKTAVSRGQ